MRFPSSMDYTLPFTRFDHHFMTSSTSFHIYITRSPVTPGNYSRHLIPRYTKLKFTSRMGSPQLNGLHLVFQPFGQWFDYHPVQLETIFINYCIFPTNFNYNNCRSMHHICTLLAPFAPYFSNPPIILKELFQGWQQPHN